MCVCAIPLFFLMGCFVGYPFGKILFLKFEIFSFTFHHFFWDPLMWQFLSNFQKAVGYHNAGTVEFIVDTLSGQFYFMEMNTRLQVLLWLCFLSTFYKFNGNKNRTFIVCLVGQDLVKWKICVAKGKPLLMNQSQVPFLVQFFHFLFVSRSDLQQ